jgi:aspartate kinase
VVTFSEACPDITEPFCCALDVEVYENFTDVDSVFVANPRLIKDPKPISVLTYKKWGAVPSGLFGTS